MKKRITKQRNRHRLRVFRSNKHIYAQVIDDTINKTIIASSSLCPKLKEQITSSATCISAAIVGKDVASKLKNKGIKDIIFDKGQKIYHGRVKALAEAARNAGINF